VKLGESILFFCFGRAWTIVLRLRGDALLFTPSGLILREEEVFLWEDGPRV